jgi:polyhydroxyalkanoate synthesis repressor PhaR
MSSESHNDTPPQVADPADNPKVIKRYSNRKLYDTDRSKYVTLDEIARMIKAGDEIVIIDNESKEDLTAVTLTQIIYEEEKRESRMPLGMLRNLIQTGGTSLQEFFDKQVKAPAMDFRENVEKSIEKNVEEIVQGAAHVREVATRSVTEFTESARRMFSREERRAEEFNKNTSALLDQLDQQVQQRITDVGDALLQASKAAYEQDQERDADGPKAAELIAAQRQRLAVDPHVTMLRARLKTLEVNIEGLETAGRQEAPVAADFSENSSDEA